MKGYIFFVSSWLVVASGMTQDLPIIREDTLSVIVVEAVSIQSPHQTTPVMSINLKSSELKGVTGLAEVVNKIAGISIRDYGGNGGLTTWSARGTQASQNLLVINSMIMNDAITGSANLSDYPLFGFHQMNIQLGGYSSDASNGAFGSVIRLSTHSSESNKTGLKSEVGSFGYWGQSIQTSLPLGNLQMDVSGGFLTSEGDFRISYLSEGQTETTPRRFNQSSRYYGQINLNQSLEGLIWNLHIASSLSDQGVPGPVFTDFPDGRQATLKSGSIYAIPSLTFNTNGGHLQLSALSRYNHSVYQDESNSNQSAQESDFTEFEQAFRLEWSHSSGETGIHTGLYTRYQRMQSRDEYAYDPNYYFDRIHPAVYTTIRTSTVINDFIMNPFLSVRFDISDQFYPFLSGSLGFSLENDKTTIDVSVNRQIRYPSLSEWRYRPVGQVLRPETMFGADVSVTRRIQTGYVRISPFIYRISDKLIAVPKNPVIWSVYNARNVLGTGLSVDSEWSISRLRISQSANIQSIRHFNAGPQLNDKQLVYTPMMESNLTVTYYPGFIHPFMSWQWVGKRFTTEQNQSQFTLDPIHLIDIGIDWMNDFSWIGVRFSATVKNAFDTNYEWVRSYPMPGRWWLVSLEFFK